MIVFSLFGMLHHGPKATFSVQEFPPIDFDGSALLIIILIPIYIMVDGFTGVRKTFHHNILVI
jgi:hypothetical protein